MAFVVQILALCRGLARRPRRTARSDPGARALSCDASASRGSEPSALVALDLP